MKTPSGTLVFIVWGIYFSLISCLPIEEDGSTNSFKSKPPHSSLNIPSATGAASAKRNDGEQSHQDDFESSSQLCQEANSEKAKGNNVKSKSCNTLISEPSIYKSIVTREHKNIKDPEINLRSMFIEEIDNYPEDEIRTLLKHTPEEIKSLYNVINTQLDPNANLTERIAHHFEKEEPDLLREESVCRSVIRNIYPRQAARYNSLVYVPNNQEFMQVIQAEICQYPEQDCSYLQDNLPYGLTSACVQKYSYKKLLFVDPLEKRMSSDLFRYPSCCTCYIRSVPLDLRIGLDSSNSSSDSYNLRQPLNSLSANQSSSFYSAKAVPILVTEGQISSTASSLVINDEVSRSPIRNQSEIIEYNAGGSRNGKALTSSISSVSSDSNRLHKRLGSTTTTKSPIRSQAKANQAKEVNLSPSTVVLHYDKVYNPETHNSESKK